MKLRGPATALLVLLTATAAAAQVPAGEPAADPDSLGFPLDGSLSAPLDAADRERLGPPRGQPLSGTELAARTRELASTLRCPSCQGLSVADSPTASSAAMRARIAALLAAGYSEEQVRDDFEAAYGEFIHLAPRLRGFNLFVWLAPLAMLAIGAALVLRRLRRAAAAAASGAAAGDDELERLRRQVREETGP